MSRVGYVVRLEADQSRVMTPVGKVSGNSRLDLSTNQLEQIDDYQYSIMKKREYNNDHSSPINVEEYDQGEWRHFPDSEDIIPESEQSTVTESEDTDDTDEPDILQSNSTSDDTVELGGYEISQDELDKLDDAVEKKLEKYGDKLLDSPDEISDNINDSNTYYCNIELDSGGQCEREVDSPKETCWQH